MKKNMFYNYDYEQKEKPHYEPLFTPGEEDRCVGTANTRLIKNKEGKEIGVEAKENSLFRLYFTFEGFVEESNLPKLLSEATFTFKVFNHRSQLVFESPVEIYPSEQMASVTLVSEEDGPLKFGNYRMQLDMIIDDITYTLFAQNDGILSIE